jgi:hypothetical protein
MRFSPPPSVLSFSAACEAAPFLNHERQKQVLRLPIPASKNRSPGIPVPLRSFRMTGLGVMRAGLERDFGALVDF